MLLEYSVFLKYDPASQIHASVGTVPSISVNGAPYQIVLDGSGDDEKHGGAIFILSSAHSTLTVLRTIKSTYFGIEEMCVVKSPTIAFTPSIHSLARPLVFAPHRRAIDSVCVCVCV